MRTILLAFVISVFMTSVAAAQSNCDGHKNVVKRLARQYQETQAAIGVTVDGNIIEVFLNSERGTWTIVVTDPTGIACAVTSGQNWEFVKQQLGSPSSFIAP